MSWRRRLLRAALLLSASSMACACGGSAASGPGGGSGGTTVQGNQPCAAAAAAITALYRADAGARHPGDAARIAEATRDNTAMALAECALRSEVAACAQRAATAQQLEQRCLAALDDEGSEGQIFRR